MYDKPKVTIDLDEYNSLLKKQEELSSSEKLTDEELSICISELLKLVQYGRLKDFNVEGIEVKMFENPIRNRMDFIFKKLK